VDIAQIKKLVVEGEYELSKHADKERRVDMISILEIEEAVKGGKIIEDYPDDPRGSSCLVLGWAKKRPVHIVCGILEEPRVCRIITVYDPSKKPQKWTENYEERRR
jgi:hypothetical protein